MELTVCLDNKPVSLRLEGSPAKMSLEDVREAARSQLGAGWCRWGHDEAIGELYMCVGRILPGELRRMSLHACNGALVAALVPPRPAGKGRATAAAWQRYRYHHRHRQASLLVLAGPHGGNKHHLFLSTGGWQDQAVTDEARLYAFKELADRESLPPEQLPASLALGGWWRLEAFTPSKMKVGLSLASDAGFRMSARTAWVRHGQMHHTQRPHVPGRRQGVGCVRGSVLDGEGGQRVVGWVGGRVGGL